MKGLQHVDPHPAYPEELGNKGIETETIQLGGKKIRGCTVCGKCFENRDRILL